MTRQAILACPSPAMGGYLVKEIGLYQTTLIPKDTRPTTVPNGYFLGEAHSR